jgi:hypothetical protein
VQALLLTSRGRIVNLKFNATTLQVLQLNAFSAINKKGACAPFGLIDELGAAVSRPG